MYNSIHSVNFGLFLRVAEYRRSISKLNNLENLNDFASVTCIISPDILLKEEDLLDLN